MADMDRRRQEMVRHQLLERDIDDPAVLEAMARVPREEFVPEHLRHLAYADAPLPIGREQTISQPYVVALMTEALELSHPGPDSRPGLYRRAARGAGRGGRQAFSRAWL